jgi:transcriptional regulator GlxA family with amidase domain
MAPRSEESLNDAERHAIVLIKDLRRRVALGELPEKLGTAPYLAHHLIMLYHGHVRLRLSRIAPALGVTVRTLERSFKRNFQTSAKSMCIQERLSFAKSLILDFPDLKMSVVGKQLGYDDPNVFERFFRRHVGNSPKAWQQSQTDRELSKSCLK